MQKRDAYPFDTATGACFLTGNYDPAEGIVDLDRYLDALPPFGRLCLSPTAVRMLVQTMGWELADLESLGALQNEVDELRAENQRLRAAIAHILDARTLARIDDWMKVS
jgi:hypothetical protein